MKHVICLCCLQELGAARERAAGARAAVKSGEAALADLETAIPRARLEASAHADRAKDLRSRLSQLEAATKVQLPPTALSSMSPASRLP